MFLLSELTVMVVTLRVWFHGPSGEDVAHCIVTNILGHLAKLEEISGGRGGRAGGKEEEEGERREEEEGRREKGRGREKGKEEGENNGWNAPVTKENGRGELGQKESLPGCGTEGEEEGELTWVCDHSHGGGEGGCTHSLTLQCLLINTRCYHQQGYTDGGRGIREGEREGGE